MAVRWSGARFRVVLHGKGRAIGRRDTFIGAIEQRNMRDLRIGRQAFRINGETVILAGDFHLARRQVFHRLIGAAMPARQLEGARPKRQ